MAKQTIAVDIDDVLAANAAGFVAYSNERWGTNLRVEDYQEHWGELWQVDMAETDRRAVEYHASGAIGRYSHYPEARSVLEELSERYRLIVLTSRQAVVQQETEDWINHNFPGVFDGIYFAGIFDAPLSEATFHRTKADLLLHHGADYLIDDQLKHCLGAAQHGVQALLFGNYRWNQADALPERVTRCISWFAVRAYFDRNDA